MYYDFSNFRLSNIRYGGSERKLGILINDAEGRVYTLGEEAGHLIGYVQTINADELEEYEIKSASNIFYKKSGVYLYE